MNNIELSNLIYPDIEKTASDYEAMYPARNLPEGARVTRLGPSPTGFIHLGNLYGAFVDERLAHQSGGIFYLRIEDTDDKRYVEGAVDMRFAPFHNLAQLRPVIYFLKWHLLYGRAGNNETVIEAFSDFSE